MTDAEIATIEKCIVLLRRYGVKSMDCGGLKLEMGPPIDDSAPAKSPAVDIEQCRCGHGEHQHMNGLCVMGCEPEKCLRPDGNGEMPVQK